MALVVLLVGVAVAQVPVTRWHSDVTVWLPFDAVLTPEADCGDLVADLGVDVMACYAWDRDEGQYVVLLGSFLSRGYELVSETATEAWVAAVFSHEGREHQEAMVFGVAGGRVLIAAYRP